MIAQSDEIGNDFKEIRKQSIAFSLKTRSLKILLEHRAMSWEYKKLKKKYNDLLGHMTLANIQTFGSSRIQKGICKKKYVKGKRDENDDFDE